MSSSNVTEMEMYSGKDKILVSAVGSSYCEERPRRLQITMRFAPDAPCALFKNPDGSCVVRPIIDPLKRLQILRAVLKNNLHNPPSDSSASVLTEQSCSASALDRLNNQVRVSDSNSADSFKVKPTCDPPVSVVRTTKERRFVPKMGVYNGHCSDSLKAKKQEPKPKPKPNLDVGLEMKLKESKRKFQEQYKGIEERRKRIKLIDPRDALIPPEIPNTRRRRW